MKLIPVKFFQQSSGKQPVRDVLLALTKEEKKIVGKDIKAAQLGWPMGLPLVDSIGKGLWEIRSTLPDKIVRVFFIVHSETFILLHAIVKKSQKAPPNDIAIARKRAAQFIQESAKGKK